MTRRLNKEQQQYILRAMLDLARFLNAEGVPLLDILLAVSLLHDELVHACQQDIVVVPFVRNFAMLPNWTWPGFSHPKGFRCRTL